MKANAKRLPTTITVTVPLRFERRGGRKRIISPVSHALPLSQPDNALLKALARAHRWRHKIETGDFESITELAKAERITQSYACRLLRLTLLCPDIIQAALDGREAVNLTMEGLRKPFPADWDQQREYFQGPL